MIAAGDEGTAAARPLAHDVYRDEALKPGIDDATARVLIGEAPAEDAPPKLKEISELRASVSRADSEVAARRLLAVIGADLSARLVVSVAIVGGRPVAKVLRVETATFEGVELGATVETTAAGEKLFQWPGATATLQKLVPPATAGALATAGASAKSSAGSVRAASKVDGKAASSPLSPKPAENKSVWSAPWFWASLGGVVAIGATVIVIAKVSEDDGGTLRLQGRVAP